MHNSQYTLYEVDLILTYEEKWSHPETHQLHK